jgi:hypothetical protein
VVWGGIQGWKFVEVIFGFNGGLKHVVIYNINYLQVGTNLIINSWWEKGIDDVGLM